MSRLTDMLRRNQDSIGSVFPIDLNGQTIYVFDFTENNPDLRQFDIASAKDFDRYVKETLKKHGATVGIGKYDEDRTIYKHSPLFSKDERTVHLGIDVALPAGTRISAPFDSSVQSFADNVSQGDYGPTIILQHTIDDITFYTLYGHMTKSSLVGRYEGQRLAKGEQVGEIGTIDVNGQWFEHLHFEIIGDISAQKNKGDFYGVCKIDERLKWLEVCPDPNLILKIKKLEEK